MKMSEPKRKILIVNKSFALGGVQTALNNMLHEVKDEYNVDLLVFFNGGALKGNLPEGIKVIEPCLLVRTLGMTYDEALKSKNAISIIFKITSSIWAKLFGNTLPINIALKTQKIIKGYDIAIAYHQEANSRTMLNGFNRFVLDCIDAKLKIAWVHADFLMTGLGTQKNYNIYSKFDKIISVSKATMNSFVSCFPSLKDKCDYCYNFLPAKEILIKSHATNNVFPKTDNELILFSACRFSKEKGLPRAIMALIPLFRKGYNFKWYIAGTGLQYEKMHAMLEENELQDKVFLLGIIDNPYPYMREADLFFLPSYHETFSMVVAEAKVLGTKVLTTDIPVMRELLSNKSGYICENTKNGITEKLEDILNQNQFRKVHYEYQNDSFEKFKAIVWRLSMS